MTRYLITQVIREVVRGWPTDDVQVYVDFLPTKAVSAAMQFCEENDLGYWFYIQIRSHNINVAAELYNFIDESNQAVVQRKEVEASGDNNHARA